MTCAVFLAALMASLGCGSGDSIGGGGKHDFTTGTGTGTSTGTGTVSGARTNHGTPATASVGV